MRNQVSYEWCIEHTDCYGDIQDHDRSEKLTDIWPPKFHVPGCAPNLVLIRDEGNDRDGLVDRGWAYANKGNLPAEFSDENNRWSADIPKRFYREISRVNFDEVSL